MPCGTNRAIRDSGMDAIREFIKYCKEEVYHPDLKRQVESVMTNLNHLVPRLASAAPNLISNINTLLDEGTRFLQSRSGDIPEILEQLRNTLDNVNQAIQNVDTTSLNDSSINLLNTVIHSLSYLQKQTEEHDLFGKVDLALTDFTSTSASFKSLIELAKELGAPAKIALYGMTGSYVAQAIMQALTSYAKNKKDEELLRIAEASLYIDIAIARQLSTQTLIQNAHYHAAVVASPNNALIAHGVQDAETIMTHTTSVNPYALAIISDLKNKIEDHLEKFYQEIKNDSIDSMLDLIGPCTLVQWESVENYIYAYHNRYMMTKWLRSANTSNLKNLGFDRLGLTYDLVKRYYYDPHAKKNPIQEIASSLVKDFEADSKLYQLIADERCSDAGSEFSFLAVAVTHPMDIETVQSPDIQRLSKVHREVLTELQGRFKKADDFIKSEMARLNLELNASERDIIKARAYAEFLQMSIKYLITFRAIPRQVFNGMITDPINFSMELAWAIFHPIATIHNARATGMREPIDHAVVTVRDELWNRPSRLLATFVMLTSAVMITRDPSSLNQLLSWCIQQTRAVRTELWNSISKISMFQASPHLLTSSAMIQPHFPGHLAKRPF